MRLKQSCFLCHKTALNCICPNCENILYSKERRCLNCATILKQPTNYCANCLRKPPNFDNAYTLFTYNSVVSYLIKQFKYQDKLFIGKFFAQKIQQSIKTIYKDELPLIIAMPIHKNKIKQRGFNQVIELLSEVKHQTVCQRIKETLSFTNLKLSQRQKEIKNAFKCQKINNKHILLVDDVMTTTSSINELAREIKKQKSHIERIDVLCLARA
ncbi:Competence protein F homolog, phosphoribosyltransferase domain; protein YhgH required for utilization of DNA as sole source of carbon and energy [hydrothermal vent metagenome]|uniref:Competence protein F homolog, phosphoribosyltransferase domain protein YhgH required for utilization of DNA as sole source of carbon and energy n=1 Tax=hydrothermal vent metagenome TaxID=652676 RepID=A0A1W1CVW5_9ZZZZ